MHGLEYFVIQEYKDHEYIPTSWFIHTCPTLLFAHAHYSKNQFK